MKTKKFPISLGRNYQNDLDNPKTINFLSLYRFATKWDAFLLIIGIIFSFLKSFAHPLVIVVYGEFTALIVDRTLGIETKTKAILLPVFGGGKMHTNATAEQNYQDIIDDSIAYGIWLSIAALLQFILGIISLDCFNFTALRQITRIRNKFFQSLLRQEVGWYDVAGRQNNCAVHITEDMEKIREGIAEKVSHFLFMMGGAIICCILAFVYGWKLSLIVVSIVPIVIIMNIVFGKIQAALSVKELNSHAAAANLAEEVISSIRTVFAFSGEKVEIERYNKRLINTKKTVKLKGLLSGLVEGIMRFLFFLSAAVGFWFGVNFVLDDRYKEDKEYTPATLMTVFFALVFGADSLARTAPYLQTFADARGSAAVIFRIIDRKSKINSMSNEGKWPDVGVQGNIVFKNVHFSYPSRPSVEILRGLDLKIQAGQSVALVGDSGNGKSTCLQLLQRFYDPDDGQIQIDDCDIRTLNINMLRSNIATVGQEPILFSTTIGENIRYGNPAATEKDVVAAAQMSGAHDFIANLPKGYNTLVGEKGSQLSGGQKQRIAIARAFIQNPKILLLDEATSALDYQSEKFVQETLDKASKGRTTITVSHRLSAIKGADRILFIDKGLVIEDGTHNELMTKKGRYYDMISAGRLEGDDQPKVESETKNSKKVSIKPCSNDDNDKDDDHHFSIDDMEKEVSKSGECIEYWQVFKRLLMLSKPEWFILFLATISAVIIGATLPVFAILFGDVFGTLTENVETAKKEVLLICIGFLIIGVIVFFGASGQTYLYSKAGINLTSRIRSKMFAALMRQECGWFDEEKNSTAALSVRLTGDADNIKAVLGYPIAIIFQTIATFLFGIILSFSLSVRLSLVCLAATPFTLLSVIIESRHTSKTIIIEKQSIENGIKIATEAITNIRTVASLRQEKYMIERYASEMTKVASIIRKRIAWRGFFYSLGQTIPYIGYAVTLTYGGYLIASKEIHFKDVIKIAEALLYGTFVMGQTLIFLPSIATAFVGAHRIFQIIDREAMICSPTLANKSRKPDKTNNIDYKKIDFRYPIRTDVKILKNFNLHVVEGKTIALVGASGSGKSTCIQLLQRLYDPERGRIHIGLDEIYRDISLKDLRSKLSIVSQEPVLFDKTIAENIAYGDNTREVSMEEIINAAKSANAHEFITQLPLGYETNVGIKSAQLSGGQKQRIAIARALIRNPKILLLDEATSALDNHSEQIVQQAIDSARTGRTCLVIAHRLSTVQNADAIGVICGGNIAEYGTHDELLAAGGIYTRLYNAQK